MGAIGAGISATSDLITTTQTNLQNTKIARETNAANKEIHERDIRAAEEAASLSWARSQQAASTEWQRSKEAATTAYERQVEQWNRENEYNSPYNQMQRYMQAGMNPAVMMSGQSAVASSTPSVQSASPSAAQAPQQQIPPAIPMQPWRVENYQLGQGIANIFAQLTQAQKNIADAGKSGAETRQLDATLDEVVRNLKADAVGKEIMNNFAPFIQKGNLQRNSAEVFALYQQALKASADGQLSVAETALKKAETETEKWRSEEQRIVARTCSGLIQSRIDNIRSSSELNRASASNQRSQAALNQEQVSQLKDMHDDNVKMRHLLMRSQEQGNDLQAFELQKMRATIGDQIKVLKSEGILSAKEIEMLEEQFKRISWENNTRVYHEALDLLERVNNGITNWIPFAPDKETREDVWIDDNGRTRSHNFVRYNSKW